MRFNTAGSNIPILQMPRSEYEIALDGLEFVFHKNQLHQIKELHNAGLSYKQISQIEKRDPYEVIIALLHLARKGHRLRPFYEGGQLNEIREIKS